MFMLRKKYHVLMAVIMERSQSGVTIAVVAMEQYHVVLVTVVERFHNQQPVVLVEEIGLFPEP
jgi:hypothetical protein